LTGLLWLVSSAVAGALAGEFFVELVELFGDVGVVRQPGVPVDTGTVGTVSQVLHFGVELIGHGLPVPSPSLLRQVEGGSEGGDSPADFASPPNARFMIDRLSFRRPQSASAARTTRAAVPAGVSSHRPSRWQDGQVGRDGDEFAVGGSGGGGGLEVDMTSQPVALLDDRVPAGLGLSLVVRPVAKPRFGGQCGGSQQR
jgi:hypothetical protein